MDLTPPGGALEGYIYLNNSTGETITVYKKNKSATSKAANGTKFDFPSYEALITYLAHKKIPQTSANTLSLTEWEIIEDIAKSYGLKVTVDYLGSKATGTPYAVIVDTSGKTVFNIRKIENKFFFNKFTYNPDGSKADANSVLHSANWPQLVKAIHKNFKEQVSTSLPPAPKVDKFDPNEVANLNKLAAQFHLYTNEKQIKWSDKQYAKIIEFLDPKGKVIWNVAKYEGTYRIYKVIDNTLDLVHATTNVNDFFERLKVVLHAPDVSPQDGITQKEYERIREVIDKYGDDYWPEYVNKSSSQPAYVEVVGKDAKGLGQIIFSIGSLGGYYQINDSQNKPLETTTTFQSLLKLINVRMMSIAKSQHEISPVELNEIASLVTQNGFTYHKPEGDEPYTYVNNQELIEVEQYGIVKYKNIGVFGPVYWKQPQEFISWFKNVRMTGKVPSTPEQFADQILIVLDSAGFISKNAIVPHLKINAITALRAYIMQVTGGPCGLGKSKWAIENITKFLDYVRKYGLPNTNANTEEFLVHLETPPPEPGGPNEFTNEEYQAIAGLVNKHSPTLNYQFTNSFVIWVGTYITSYKVAKESGIYRVYTDKGGEWVIQTQYSTFKELVEFLDDMLAHIVKALAHSKLEQPTEKTTPSSDPDKLSADEVGELKKLIKKFGLPVSTSYTKKLMEEIAPKDAYSVTVTDAVHNIQVKLYRKEGKYIIAKGADDSYYSLKTFDAFYNLLSYLDYFLNSYIKEPTPSIVEKLTDEEFNLIKELPKKYNSKAKVRHKYLKSKDGVKIPYIAIDPPHGYGFAISKSKLGEYKLFKVNKGAIKNWETLSVMKSFEAFYDVVTKAFLGEPVGTNIKYTPPVLGPEQIEWLETLMKTQKPTVVIKQWPSGGVGGYDPTNKMYGEDNPLFIIRFVPGSSHQRILQVHTEDGGGAYDEYPFANFDVMANFISSNIEIVTQLLKGEFVPEGKLASLMTDAGLQYQKKTEVALDSGGAKMASVYENNQEERLYLFDDGSSRMWYKKVSNMGNVMVEFNMVEFKTIAELVNWMEENYKGKTSKNFKEIQEYIAYLGFISKSNTKHSSMWGKQIGPDHQPQYDYVHVRADGHSKVTAAPLVGEDKTKTPYQFSFETFDDLREYLTGKYIKGTNAGDLALASVLEKGKFKKNGDQSTEMGYKWVSDKMLIVPFPSGGIMQTINVESKVSYSFESTYDLAKAADEFVMLLSHGTADKKTTTGDKELDAMLHKAGFICQGTAKGDDGEKILFQAGDGKILKFYTADKTSGMEIPPTPPGGTGPAWTQMGFTNIKDLKDYLSQGLVMTPASTDDKKLAGTFAYGSLGTVTPKKKKKKVLAGTEDMPWSGTNYKILWAGQPANTGMVLNDMEEATMYKLGWHRGQDTSGPGQAYYKGNEKMRFFKHEKVEYWSNYGSSVTQTWDEVEMPIRWLWKNKI